MTQLKQNTRYSFSFIYNLTGNPFVDGGIAALCALNGRNSPQDITREDLERSTEFVVQIYPMWQKLRYLFTQNCLLLHPSVKNKAERYEKYMKDLVHKISNASTTGDCAICGMRDSGGLVFRQQHPLTGSGDLVNYFSFFEPGLPLCPACMFALQLIPLYLVSNDGTLFLVHSHSQKFMLDLAKRALVHVRARSAAGEKLGYYSPFSFAKNKGDEFLVKLARLFTSETDTPYGRISIRLYLFMNSGQLNFLNFLDLPTDIFVFIERAHLSGLGKNLDYFFKVQSPSIYRALLEEKKLTSYFLRQKNRELIGGWELYELYLIEVEKMDEKRLEIIKKVGKNLYECLKSGEFRPEDLELINSYGDLRMLLTKMQKKRLIWEIDDEMYLFPRDKEGAVRWKETQLILLAYIYEQMHKENLEVS